MFRILLVEDNKIIRNLEEEYLCKYGLLVFAVATAEAACAAVATMTFDCAIIDIRLTGSSINGIALAEKFRALLSPQAAIILITEDETQYQVAANEVADVCLRKSQFSQIPRAIETALYLRRMQSEIKAKMDTATDGLLKYSGALAGIYQTTSDDGAELFHAMTRDKHLLVWSVYSYRKREEENRVVIALASGIGCPLDCGFCKSGPPERNLLRPTSVGEMVAQAYYGLRAEHVRRIWECNARVDFNWTAEGDSLASGPRTMENAREALHIISKSLRGLDHGFIFTTVGNVKMLRLFRERYADLNVSIYWSLHSAIQAKREKIMALAANQPMADLRDALYDIMAAGGFKRKVTVAIMVIKGFNDGMGDVLALREFLGDLAPFFRIKVQAIQPGSLPWAPPTDFTDACRFAGVLRDAGFEDVRCRLIVGFEIGASCGHTVPVMTAPALR